MISGKTLSKAIISGANNIANHKNEVDKLNVFPVPDGDTGTNMSMTISAGKKALENLDSDNIAKISQTCADALLRGARGNSGVILSLLFRGFAKGLKNKTVADASDIANALSIGVDSAYKSVMTPTEGTILTVSRVAAEKATEKVSEITDPVEMFELILKEAKIALEDTPKLLPVLAKAGVVDAGGMGFVVIFEGMLEVLKGGEIIPLSDNEKDAHKVFTDAPIAHYEGEIKFTYCTEFIIEKNDGAKDALALRAYLETLGDSVVVVDDDSIIKVHVHTNNPGKALEEALLFGGLVNIKIENMKEQFATKQHEVEHAVANDEYQKVDEDIEIGFVAVAAGDGITQLFMDLGVDKVVKGGQTMNPSTEDLLRAIESVPAKRVFVLPNNKNIIMAAEQTISLADREVCVLQTRSIPQGLSAMLAFDPDEDYIVNRTNMTKAFDKVQTGQITFAARNSDFDGHNIKKGEILALENGKLNFVERDVSKAMYKLTRSMCKKSDGKFVTIIYGSDVTDMQAEAAYQQLANKLSDDYEINLVNGGQPVYYYIISVD